MTTPASSVLSSLLHHSQYRSKFERLLTTLSIRFINLPIDAIDDGIVEALAQVGGYTGVQRCFVYQFADESRQTARLSHEWVAAGIPPIKHRLQDLPLGPLSWVVDQLAAGNIVHVPDREELPAEASNLKNIYESLGVRSAVYLPLILRGEIVGMLGFSCTTHTKIWSEDSINLLRVLGEIVINAIDRQSSYINLQASEERFKSVVEDQTEFIVRWTPDGNRTFVNEAVCRFLGLSEEELLCGRAFDFIHPDDLERLRQKVASLTPRDPIVKDEHRVLLPDGSVAWHEWLERGLFDASGNVIEYQAVGRDITSEKLAREELAYRQQLENLILTLTMRFINLPPGRLKSEVIEALKQVGEFSKGDRTYIYLFDEQATEATLEYEWLSPRSLPTPDILRSISQIKHDWALPLLQEGHPLSISSLDEFPPQSGELRDALEQIRTQSFALVPVFLDSRLYAALGISSTERDVRWSRESMDLLRLIGEVFVNAMARKAAEQALADSEARLRLTIDAVADGFYDWNIPQDEVYVSDNWLKHRGLPAGANAWPWKDWQAFIHPDDRAEVAEVREAHLRGSSGVFDCEYRVRMQSGDYRWTLDRGRVIERDKAGRAVRMVGVDRDITEEIQSRARLQEADAHLAHLARVATMGEVVAGIAHEVNQPLHAAATFASAINTALSNPDAESLDRVSEMVRKISKQINRAASIIRGLRNFTRPRPVRMARFDLNGLVRESAEMFAFDARRNNVRIAFDLDESLPAVIGDRVQVQQVIVNLLRNAVDACRAISDRPRIVNLKTRPHEEGILLEVMDNGIGLSSDKAIEPLFDAFATTKENGMGMGLAFCRSIVASHHGKIWGESNLESGMTFSVVLPVKQEPRRE